MSQTTYLELVEGVGVEPTHVRDPKTGEEKPHPKAGEPAPINHIGFQVPIPTMVEGELVMQTAAVTISQEPSIDPDNPVASRIIPGTRIVETNAPAVVNALLERGDFRLCDPPAKHHPKAKSEEAKS
ncbi:MAG: hypothetical protein ACRDK4_05010 [Solirubrobacteraceae bacterium]